MLNTLAAATVTQRVNEAAKRLAYEKDGMKIEWDVIWAVDKKVESNRSIAWQQKEKKYKEKFKKKEEQENEQK